MGSPSGFRTMGCCFYISEKDMHYYNRLLSGILFSRPVRMFHLHVGSLFCSLLLITHYCMLQLHTTSFEIISDVMHYSSVTH